ncbi:rab5 GDP/GTP exchange factor-like isoform X2 [Hyperolius riggenbachi]
MSSVSPGQDLVPLHQEQKLTSLPNDYVPLQFQGLLYKPEMCRKNCGFYGNPAWHGYCSRCWIQKRQQTQPLKNGFRHHSAHLLCKSDGDTAHQHYIGKEVYKSSNINRSQSAVLPNEDQTANNYGPLLSSSRLLSLGKGNFTDFLKALQKPDAKELQIHCTTFIQRMQNAKNYTVDKKAEAVQALYKEIGDNISDDMSEVKDQLLDNIEKLVMTQLYKSVFCPDGSVEEKKDLLLQNQIRSLRWVTPKMLQFSLCEQHQEVKDQIAGAVMALVEMDSKRAPQDKLLCLSKACSHLFRAIEVSTKEPATTDDLVSGLIYITIKANPPRLFSNVNYITRFCNPKRLMTGKCAYWFANICSATSYIETMDFSSLDLTEEEFHHIMQQKQLEGKDCTGDNVLGAVQQMEENKQRLADLQDRQESMIQKAECLLGEIKAWPDALQKEVQEILHKFPLNTKHCANV